MSSPSYAEPLRLARFLMEKCELREARIALEGVVAGTPPPTPTERMEAIAGLLRLAAESRDQAEILRWDRELEEAMAAARSREGAGETVPPIAWYCKAVTERAQGRSLVAQRAAHRYLHELARAVRPGVAADEDPERDWEPELKGWIFIAILFYQRGRRRRARQLVETLLARHQRSVARGFRGYAHLLLAYLEMDERRWAEADRHLTEAYGEFLREHNWYYHLYALYGFAVLARRRRNYAQASWYLDLLEGATRGPEFGLLRADLQAEREKLSDEGVDLLLDPREGAVRTREQPRIDFGKQFVLLDLLDALAQAPAEGLTKADLVNRVWREAYRPAVHDNKLYFNINRLRKLIEPDAGKPKYLLNGKGGYRLAPGLQIRRVDGALSRRAPMHLSTMRRAE